MGLLSDCPEGIAAEDTTGAGAEGAYQRGFPFCIRALAGARLAVRVPPAFMEIVSVCPLHAASLTWRSERAGWMLTVVCKGTFTLLPDESPLASEQEYPNEDDNYWDDDPARSLYSPSDLVPFKVRADVMLVGHAFAPRGEPVRSLTARLIVVDVDNAIEIFV